MSDTLTHAPTCPRPRPQRDRFKPGWVRLKCPACQHVANLTEAAMVALDYPGPVTPASGYVCREHNDQEVTPKGHGCPLCIRAKRKAPQARDDEEFGR